MFDPNTYYGVERKAGPNAKGLVLNGRETLATFKGHPDCAGNEAADFAYLHNAEVYTLTEAEYWMATELIEEKGIVVETEHCTLNGIFFSYLLPDGRVVFNGPDAVNLYDNFMNFQYHLEDDSEDFGLQVSVKKQAGQKLSVTPAGFILK